MGKATVYCIIHTERCVAQVSTAGECKIYFEDFMPYGLVLKESNDFDTRINNVISFHSWCASRLILRDRTLCKGKDLVILTQRIFAGGDSFTLMAIPLFIFAGEIMNACGVTKRIVGFANELVGFIPGGLAHVNILASMLFAGVSGSTSADVASIGGMLIGSMDEAGFDRDYATAVTAASATIGSIIPPSILMVLYSSITGISVGKLFMAGVIPGILVGVSQMIYAFIKAKKNPAKYDGDVKVKFDFKRMVKSFINALPALVMPLIIIGGILSGVFTATEAGAIAGAYGLIIGIFVYKEFTFEGAIKTVLSAARTSGMTMLIVASTTAFGYCLAIEKFPEQVSALLTGISTNPNVLMLLMIIAMCIIGMFMDTTSAAIIMVPIFYPIAAAAGIDGIHFGMVMVLTFILGGITPPVGVTLYIATAVAKIKFTNLLKEMWPFILLFIAVMFAVAYCPAICLTIPNMLA